MLARHLWEELWISSFREARFILAHGFRESDGFVASGCAEAGNHSRSMKQRKLVQLMATGRETDTQTQIPGYIPNPNCSIYYTAFFLTFKYVMNM